MDEKSDVIVKCGKCGAEIDERHDIPVEIRSPCPRCGSKERNIVVSVRLEAKFYEGIRAKSFPPNSRKFEMDVQSGEFTSKSHRIVNKSRVIDRTRNIYSERILDEQGNVLRDVSEKLTDHKDHGSAKFNKRTKDQEKRGN